MTKRLILASGSTIRAEMLHKAGMEFEVVPGRVDEPALRRSLEAEGAQSHDVADALAEAKARKVAARYPEALVLGCDQVLEHEGAILSRPQTKADAHAQLERLRGQTHRLLSAAVLYHDAQPVWRHVGEARLTMRAFSDRYLVAYLQRNWPGIGESAGAYKLEEEGVRLFARVEGSYFTILGLPLLELLNHLAFAGEVEA